MADYRPRHQYQLNAPGAVSVPKRTKGSRDCGPRSVSVGIDFLTRGQKVPAVRDLRDRGDVEGPQMTNIDDLQRMVESFDLIQGRRPLRFFKKDHITDVKVAVSAGKAVQICIDYGKFNQLAAKTGDPYFEGGHSALVCGERTHDGEVEWLYYDSLDDARRAGIAGPGPRWVKRSILVQSMEALAKAQGRCYAGVFGGGQKRD